jgi:hypothetical protein
MYQLQYFFFNLLSPIIALTVLVVCISANGELPADPINTNLVALFLFSTPDRLTY